MNNSFTFSRYFWLGISIVLFLIIIIGYFGNKRWSCKNECRNPMLFGSFASQEDCERLCKPKTEIKEVIKYIDRPVEVEKIVEKRVEVPVEKPVYIQPSLESSYPSYPSYPSVPPYFSYPYLTSNFPDLYPLPYPFYQDGWGGYDEGRNQDKIIQKVNINQKVLHPKVNVMKAPTGPAKLKRK